MLVGGFADGFAYALNLDRPDGVKYLTPSAHQLLVRPTDVAAADATRKQLAAHGLMGHSSTDQQPSAVPARSLTAWLHVSNACNLGCHYCYIPLLTKHAKDPSAHGMSRSVLGSTLVRLFRHCSEQGIVHLNLKFAGGEPTLDPGLLRWACQRSVELSREFPSVRPQFKILTNAVFNQAREVLDLFSKFRFAVSISLDGGRLEHDAVRFRLAPNGQRPRRRAGTFDEVLSNVQRLLERGIKPYILCTVTRFNMGALRPLVELCMELGIGLRLSPVRDVSTACDPRIHAELTEHLVEIYRRIGAEMPVAMPIERFLRFAEWNLRKAKDIPCGVLKSSLAVTEAGKVATCQMRMDEAIDAPDLDLAVATLRATPENFYLNNPSLKTGDCITCDWRYQCAGGCPEHSRLVFGTTNHSSPWCGLYYELFPVYVEAIGLQMKRTVDALAA